MGCLIRWALVNCIAIRRGGEKPNISASFRKKRVRKHIIADLSINYVEKMALIHGFSVERIMKDYGYDLSVKSFDQQGECENGNIYVQVKATDRPKHLDNKTDISFSVSKRDLNFWYAEPFPVIFILYDAKRDLAYWTYIQQYLRDLPGFDIANIPDSYTIRISKNNVIDKSSFETFRVFKSNTLKEIENAISYNS